MAVQAFVSTDAGWTELLGTKDLTEVGSKFYACLLKHGGVVNQTTLTYTDFSGANVTATKDVPGRAAAVDSNKARFTHTKITFEAEGDLAGRYVVYLIGDHESPQAADKAIGYVDLTGAAEDAESVNAEFSFTPHADRGLFEIARAAAV